MGERVAGGGSDQKVHRGREVSLGVEEGENVGDGHWAGRKPRARGWRKVSGEGKEGDDRLVNPTVPSDKSKSRHKNGGFVSKSRKQGNNSPVPLHPGDS